MGLTDLGISGHADYSMWEPGLACPMRRLPRISRNSKHCGKSMPEKSNLYIGIELDTLGPVQQAEYAIGSTHSVLKDGHLGNGG